MVCARLLVMMLSTTSIVPLLRFEDSSMTSRVLAGMLTRFQGILLLMRSPVYITVQGTSWK